MSLKAEDVEKISKLSKLSLKPDEAEKMRLKLNHFFAMVQTMKDVDTRGVVPMAHPLDAMPESNRRLQHVPTSALRLRPDILSEINERQNNQMSAPATEKGFFLVPKVIE
jgi:aspartyl-tRNA(Asn)/glutamyl-tRNA(Gln) amidotransferase subunit C